MLGLQQQTPPMVSAIQIDGQRLHELARKGIEVERAPREITVSAFDVVAHDDPRVWNFDVECSVGTYVRVLLE
jgi:tRNA pseudouridine55 synthase